MKKATQFLTFLQERRLVSDCIDWCQQQGKQYVLFDRQTLYRAKAREQKREPLTTRQRFFLEKVEEYINVKKEEEQVAAA